MAKARKDKDHQDFMADMAQFSRGAEDPGYIDDLVAHSAPPAEGEIIPVGEHIKAAREAQGLSLADVADRTGLSKEEVRQVEEELVSPNLGTLIRLSKALKTKMGTLISSAGPLPWTIVRASERKAFSRVESKKGQRLGYAFEHLAPDKGDRNMEPFLVHLGPTDVIEERSAHDGEEFIFVLSGKMEAHMGETLSILEPGDAIYYNSSQPHLVKCHGDEPATIVAVMYTD